LKNKLTIKILFSFTLLFLVSSFVYSAENKYGGTLVLSTTSDPRSFNDIMAKETSTTLVTSYIFEGLTTTNAYNLKVEPNLASKWEVSEDGLVWKFYLRDDVLWNDGKKFTADDVVFTFNDLIFNPEIPNSARDVFTIEDKPFLVEKIDDLTVQFTLPVKFAPFLRGMNQAILPKHKLKEAVLKKEFNHTWGIDTNPKEIVGTGPFKLIQYLPGQYLTFEKNPYYWKKSSSGDKLPYLDRIIYVIVQNVDVEILKFLEGSIDAFQLRGMDYPLLKPLEQKKNFKIFDLGPDLGSNFICFNLNTRKNPENGSLFLDEKKSKWFNDIKFREAISYVIDREQMIKIVKNGLGYPQYSAMSPASGFFYNDNIVKRDFDVKKAKEILKRAGYIDRNKDGFIEDKAGNTIEFNLYTNADNTERADIASIIRNDFESLGMKVNFQGLEFNTLVSKLNSTYDWDTIILGLTGGVEPHFGKNVWMSDGQLHLWNPNQETPATKWEERVDGIFNQAVQELNEDKRKVLYDEYQMIISEELPLIYTVLSARLTAVRNKFGNLNPTNYGGVFHNIEEIYIKEDSH